MVHEPCRLLGDADCAMDFVRRDSVFAVHDLPHGGKPFVQAEWHILKDPSRFQCELRRAVFLDRTEHLGSVFDSDYRNRTFYSGSPGSTIVSPTLTG